MSSNYGKLENTEKKPYKNPNTEFFRLSALTNLINMALLILILIVMLCLLYAQAVEQEVIRNIINDLQKSLQIIHVQQ